MSANVGHPSTGSLDAPTEGHAQLSGCLTVRAVCAAAALLAALALPVMPRASTILEREAQPA